MSDMRELADGRIGGDVPTMTAAEAAEKVSSDATVLVSGFGSVGYPKAVPEALAESSRDLSLTVVSGGSVGEEVDTSPVDAKAIDRRFPHQAQPASRDAVNNADITFHDRHVWRVADEVQYGGHFDVNIAVVEAVAIGENWLVPSTSIGQTPAYVECADRLVVEVNEAQSQALTRFHDVYRPAAPSKRDPIPLTRMDERIGSSRIRFDPRKLEAVVETNAWIPPTNLPTSPRPGLASTSATSSNGMRGEPGSFRTLCTFNSASVAS